MDYDTKASKRVAHMILSRLGRTGQCVTSRPDESVAFDMGSARVFVGVEQAGDSACVDLHVTYHDDDPLAVFGSKHCFYTISGYGRDDRAQINEIADLL